MLLSVSQLEPGKLYRIPDGIGFSFAEKFDSDAIKYQSPGVIFLFLEVVSDQDSIYAYVKGLIGDSVGWTIVEKVKPEFEPLLDG